MVEFGLGIPRGLVSWFSGLSSSHMMLCHVKLGVRIHFVPSNQLHCQFLVNGLSTLFIAVSYKDDLTIF